METKFEKFVEKVGKTITPSEAQVASSMTAIMKKVEDYVVKSRLESLVVGVSGGLDSAVTAAMVAPICKKLNIKLIGVSIPLSSSTEHVEQAQWVGETYCDAFMQMDEWETEGTHPQIDKTMEALNKVINQAGFKPKEEDYRVAQGNIKARLRMTSLYHVAGITKGAVLSTDNYSEGWLGFWTLHGDVGDISPIQYIEKGWEEPEFAKYLGIREDIINQKPSDGLCVTEEDCDEAQLGLSYKQIGAVIFAYEKMLSNEMIEEFEEFKEMPNIKAIIQRHKATQFKRDGVFEVKRDMALLPQKY